MGLSSDVLHQAGMSLVKYLHDSRLRALSPYGSGGVV